jgi:hypothetical protein
VPIPFFYTTSPHTRSLRPFKVPSDQYTRWRLSFYFSTNKRQEFFISPYLQDKRCINYIFIQSVKYIKFKCLTELEFNFYFCISKHEKDVFFLVKSMLRKLLGFGHMHENKTFFFVFLKEKINLKKF